MSTFDAETIARHAEAVRRLARRLVWDADRADDVAQDALVAALEQREAPRKGLGPWIKGVTRKLAANAQRSERRLKERHARAGSPAPAPAPDEVVERLRAQRLVADALTALGEPYRRTLYMRYFEDLPPRTIAAQLGLPVNTVQTHLRRGRARLRVEIEARGEGRRPWQIALLPLLRPRVPTPAPVAASAAGGLGGTLLMLANSRYAIALCVVLLLGGGFAYLRLDAPAADAPPITDEGEVATPPAAPTLEGAGARVADVPATQGEAPATAPANEAPEVHPILLAGRVLDPRGRALAGVPVRVHASSDSGIRLDPAVPIAEGQSDAQGRFEIRFDTGVASKAPESEDRWLRVHVVAIDPRWILAMASTAVSTTAEHADTRTRRSLDLRFQGAFFVRCRVVDEAGRPIGGATCRWGSGSEYNPRPEGRPYEAITDADGVARLELPVVDEPASVFLRTAGVRLVHAEAPGYARATSRSIRIIRPTPGQVIDAEIVLPASHAITGRVVDDRGEAVPDFTFALLLRRKDGGNLFWTQRLGNRPRTDAAGNFTLENVPAGSWQMEVWAPGFASAELEVEAPTRDLTLRLVRKTTIVVRYQRPDGTPLRPSIYHAVREGDPPFSRYGALRDEGPLEINRLRPGTYRITIKLVGRVKPFVHTLHLVTGRNEPQTFTVPDAEGRVVTGRLLDAEGEPVAGTVVLHPESDEVDDGRGFECRVGEAGTYRFEGVPAGRYVLEAEAEEHAPGRHSLEVADEDPQPVDIRLARGVTVRVRLPRRPPEAAWRWQLQLRASDGDTLDAWAPEPDEDGWLEFPRLPPGTTTVMLESTAFRADPIPNDTYVAMLDCADGETVEHAFPRECGVTVKGRVFDVQGKPHAQLMVVLRRVAPDYEPSRGMPTTSYGWKKVFTNDEGRFDAHGLVPGRYVVLSVRQGGVPLVFQVTGAPDQTLELRAR